MKEEKQNCAQDILESFSWKGSAKTAAGGDMESSMCLLQVGDSKRSKMEKERVHKAGQKGVQPKKTECTD